MSQSSDKEAALQLPQSIEDLQTQLRRHDYIADRALCISLFLGMRMQRPVFLEGETGVGKTEVARVLSKLLNTELIRLQCYEGLDHYQAVYDWDYTRQMLHIRLLEARGETPTETELFGPKFLLERPLLKAIRHAGKPPVLLIDEIDRADAEFEAYLLELLADFQVTIPEIGTIAAEQPPIVVITSNRTREVHDALKRRCLYHWIEYPSFEAERQIVQAKVPQAAEALTTQITSVAQQLRDLSVYKRPGVAETLDWARALVELGADDVSVELLQSTRGVLLKTEEDVRALDADQIQALVDRAHAA